MSTLKEAVESGRRWRWKGGEWEGPGESILHTWTTHQAISSDFVIEPEPEKPREWMLLEDQHFGGGLHCTRCPTIDESAMKPRRVHDADACDRLRAKVCLCENCLQGMAGGGPGR